VTDAGSVSYYAPGSEHDDGLMASLINAQKAKQYLKAGDRGIYVGSQMMDTPEITYAMGNF